jgi:glycosyltransferase involved in cell wall biosynthesis
LSAHDSRGPETAESALVGCCLVVEGKAPLRILGETAYPLSAASGRVRIAAFSPFLRLHGVELAYRPTLSEHEYAVVGSDRAVGRKALALAASATRAALWHTTKGEFLLIHRLRCLTPVPCIDPPRFLDAYDIDDALFVGSADPVNRKFQWAKQEAQRSIECLRRTRLAIVGNSFLADHARQYTKRVEVVPSCVDPELQAQHHHGHKAVVTIGWIGSRTTSAYLAMVLPAFAQLNERRTRARLLIVGGDTSLKAKWIEHRPWSLTTQSEDLATFDVGIMPLPDSPWTRGKCGYKILQYFAAGLPVVASPVGVSSEMVGSDRGYLATDVADWYSALERLVEDATERQERGDAARAFVERNYSYARWAPELARMLRSLAD